ncbi:DUF2510 domain-containing protein [Mycobacterium sp. E2327]|uniref:DUF2510 domain-containing protein n=1 Tax=Mycobacterium sp. E2327 TaxID=1834132 RepID=UPI0009EEC57A|nr:DUF2510 domain-containing protein [Mycobacterium sp. E2327]
MTTPNQPGWYDDPRDPSAQRYWDGRTWTPHQQRKPDARTARPPVMPPQQSPPAPSAAPTQVTPLPPRPPGSNLPSAAQTRAAPLPPQPPPRGTAPTAPPHPPLPPSQAPNRPAPPGYSPPGARPGSDLPAQPAPQAQSDRLAAVQGLAARMSVPAWIVLGGLLVTVISIFLPFATVSLKLFGRTLSSHGVAADGTAKFVVILLAVVAAFLALPAVSGSLVPPARLIGLSVAVALLGALTFVWFHTVATKNNEGEGFVNVTPAFGMMVYAAAVIVTAVGVVLLWMERSKAERA